MKVIIQKAISGNDFSYSRGQEVNLSAALAKAWLKSGVAKRIQGKKLDKTHLFKSKGEGEE